MVYTAAGPEAALCTLTCFPGDRGEGAAKRSSDQLAALARSFGPRIDDGYAGRLRQGRSLAEVGYAVRAVAAPTVFQTYFEADGSCFLHLAAAPERVSFAAFGDVYTAGLRTTIRLADGSGRTIFEQRRDAPLSLNRGEMKLVGDRSVQLYEALPVRPGPATAFYRVENLVDKSFFSAKKPLVFPAPDALGLTPPLLGRRGERRPRTPRSNGGPSGSETSRSIPRPTASSRPERMSGSSSSSAA